MRDVMLILHFIGLAMGVGTSFAHAFLGQTISKLERSEAKKFRNQIKVLSQMGYTGSLLLLVSGIYLILPYWPVITTLPLLILKLVLFVILMILILLINRDAAKNYKNDADENLNRMELMGKFVLILSVVIVIVAVSIFN